MCVCVSIAALMKLSISIPLLLSVVVVGEIGTALANITAKPQAADRVKDEPESVWIEFVQLALANKPLNLGQGFPDFAAPKYLIEALHRATNDSSDPTKVANNQYTRSFGHPKLVSALSTYYNKVRGFSQLEKPGEQFVVSVGAYEALFASILAFVNPGDEVIIIEPAFDAYAPMVALAQGTSVFVPLRRQTADAVAQGSTTATSFALDMAEFESKISNRTKLLVLNTPNNPLGKVYSRDELARIAELCIGHNILVLADEVYEHIYYAPEAKHVSIASLPGMWERTITVGSAGKTFSVTGWKIGWAFGPRELISYVQLIHQNSVYTVATPLQVAIAGALERELVTGGHYWAELRSDLGRKRERMANVLGRAGMRPIVPQGGYFMLADFSALAKLHPQYASEGQAANRTNTNDYRFARWLSSAKRLQGIPASAFYAPHHKQLAANLIRFCFIKSDSTLDRLERLVADLSGEPAPGPARL